MQHAKPEQRLIEEDIKSRKPPSESDRCNYINNYKYSRPNNSNSSDEHFPAQHHGLTKETRSF